MSTADAEAARVNIVSAARIYPDILIECLLYRVSARLPCRFIDGEQGEPYLERYYPCGAFGWHAYLHRFVDSDPDRGVHDHPGNRAVSLVLSGGYDEQRSAGGDLDLVSVRVQGVSAGAQRSMQGLAQHGSRPERQDGKINGPVCHLTKSTSPRDG